MSIFAADGVANVLHGALNGISFRQNVIADNIANVDTPHFRARVGRLRELAARRDRQRRGRLARRRPSRATPTEHPGRRQRQQRRPPQGDDGRDAVDVPVPDRQPLGERPPRPRPHRGRGLLMAAFDMLRIANTSLGMHQTWLDALAQQHRERQHGPQHRRGRLPGTDGHRPRPPGRRRRRRRHRAERPGGPARVRPRPPARRRGRLRPRPRDRHGQPDDAARDGPARLPGLGRQVTKNAQDTYSSALQIGRG